ncbi:TadG family pilus assembly protein [Polaromonas sp.]|uniref:TadG family pilus assembly protein n=1 Tax=Polaromonas sp. TaxID=1869339 RepID=UPI003BABC33F
MRTRPRLASNYLQRSQQQGAVAIMGAIWMMVALIVLMGLDIGNLFWQKRELQKIADMAALAGVQGTSAGCTTVQSYAQSNAQLNGLRSSGLNADTFLPADCGNWNPKLPPITEPGINCNPACYFDKTRNPVNAVRVTVSRTVPYFFVFNWGSDGRLVKATATAAGTSSRAALNVRSTLVTVDSSKSTLLNAVFGGLLGGSLNLGAVGWQGLVNTNLNLLSYLDKLAVNLGVAAGDYNTLLDTNASAGALLQAAIDVLQRDGGTAAVDAITALIALQTAVPSSAPLVKLKDILQIQSGTPAAGLDLDLQAFQLAQGLVQLANKQNSVAATVSLVNIPSIGSVNVQVKVTEPAQISAIGDPALAAADTPAFDGPNKIYVRTAQIRSLISISLPGLSGISGLLGAVTSLLTPVTSLLNNILSLNLIEALCLVNCTQTQAVLVPDNPVRLDINLDVAASNARVTGYDCSPAAAKSLTVSSETAATELRIGQMTDTQKAAVFSSAAKPVVTPIPLLDVQTKECTLFLCGGWNPYSRTGLRADTAIASSTSSHVYSMPPEINQPPSYYSFSATDIVNSLASTLSGLELQTYKYNAAATNGFGSLVGLATQLVNAAASAVKVVIQKLLSPILDPLTNFLMDTLGISLANADIGARLSCQQGAELVY